MAELRDSAIWAATCDLTAQVLPNARRPLVVRSVVRGLALVTAGLAALAVAPPVAGWILVAIGLVPIVLAPAVARTAGHLMLEADGFTYRPLAGRATSRGWDACGEFGVVRSRLGTAQVRWVSPDGGTAGAFLPGAGTLPQEDLAVLLNRYRQRFAPDTGGTGSGAVTA